MTKKDGNKMKLEMNAIYVAAIVFLIILLSVSYFMDIETKRQYPVIFGALGSITGAFLATSYLYALGYQDGPSSEPEDDQ